MSKFNRKTIFAAAGGFAAALTFAAVIHSAKAQVQTPPAAGTPAAPAPAVNPATVLPPLSGPIGPAKVGVVNIGKLFANSKKLTDDRANLENMVKQEQAISAGKHADLDKAAAFVKTLTIGTDAYHTALVDFQKKSLQVQADDKMSQDLLKRQNVIVLKNAYEDVSAAVAKVAATKGLDLVMIDGGAELPPEASEMSMEQLDGVVQTHHILYASKGIDITGDVAQQMAMTARPPAGH